MLQGVATQMNTDSCPVHCQITAPTEHTSQVHS